MNLAFLNLGSIEPCLRLAAYKLLCAVKETFKLQIDFQLDDSHGKRELYKCVLLLALSLSLSLRSLHSIKQYPVCIEHKQTAGC